MVNKVELLAPAGSMDALKAAVENGADAVYLGGRCFNARQYASNFGEEELREAVSYAHKRGVRIYVTMNISLKQEELKDVDDYLKSLYEMGIDAIIVQDLGLLKLVKESYPDFPVHASTQMTVHNSYGVDNLKRAGCSRVVLARELSYDEISEIAEKTDLELEVFVHGALCVSYSGQCLMSSMIGGRSGNRGTCAQTCRMPFSIERSRDRKQLEASGEYLLSPKDLNTLEDIGRLIDMGVKSFKIEGRMKKPEYVATVVSKYRKAIDSYIAGSGETASAEDNHELAQMFNRGFTKGLLGGDFGESFISIEKPSNRGIYLGEALSVQGRNVTVKLETDVALQDGLGIDNGSGESKSATVDRIYMKRKAVESASKGEIVALDLYAKVSSGDKLYKIYDKKLADRAKETFQNIEQEKLRLDLELEIAIGEKPVLKTVYGGELVAVEADRLAELGMKSSLTKEKVTEQIGKFGNSDYEMKSLELSLQDGSFLPLSVLNELRRKLSEELDSRRTKLDNRQIDAANPFKGYEFKEHSYYGTKLSAKLGKLSQAKYLDCEKLSRVYLPIEEGTESVAKELKSEGVEVYVYTDRIVRDPEFKSLKQNLSKLRESIDGVMCGNIGALEFASSEMPGISLCADLGLNVFNSESAKYLERFGASGVTISPELNFKEIEELTESCDFEYEAIVYGYLPLMTMVHCPMSLVKKCGSDRDCERCEFKSGYELSDRKNMKFKIQRAKDITTIYNGQRLFIPEYMGKFESAEISYARLDFTDEREEISEILDIYHSALEGVADRQSVERYKEELGDKAAFTKGHYFRGTI